jgi:hypothetical protein
MIFISIFGLPDIALVIYKIRVVPLNLGLRVVAGRSSVN